MKRISLLAVAMVLVLAFVGMAYTLWSDELRINGTVETGDVEVELSLGEIVLIQDKDVATCTAVLQDENKKLDIVIGNGYPSFTCLVEFDVHSVGSIPVHIYQPDLEYDVDALELELVDCYADDTQLHYSDEPVWCTLSIHILQEAEQNTEYGITGTIEARQYNEPRP